MSDNNIVPFQPRKQKPVEGYTGLGSLIGQLATNKEEFQERMQQVRERMPSPFVEDYRVSNFPQVTGWLCPHCKQTVNDIDTHGWFKDTQGKPIPCPVCSPTVIRARSRRKADKIIQELVNGYKLLNMANLPVEADKLSMESYPKKGDQKAKELVKFFINGMQRELLLMGGVGRGKSGLAISAAKELASKGVQVLFLPASDYISLLLESYNHQGDNNIEDATRLVEVLILDDLGMNKGTEHTVLKTQELIERRHAAGLRTLITTNWTLQGLQEYWRLDSGTRAGFQPVERIISRLDGWYTPHVLNGPDLRLAGKRG